MMGDPADGRFGEFGGRFVPESLMPACIELEAAFRSAWADPAFHAEFQAILRDYGGRPTPVTECRRISERLGVRVLLKREDLAHTGSHKLNNVIGQALLARRMGKQRLIAETGAGQHGVATATAAALFGMECAVYMGEVDTERQALNVFRMELLGAEVRPVYSGEPHPEGRRQRGPARVGGDRRAHPLLPRIGHGPASVSVDGAAVPAHRGRRGAPPVPRPARTGPIPTGWSPVSGEGPTRRAPSPGSSTPTPSWSGSSRPAGPPSAAACPVSCTA